MFPPLTYRLRVAVEVRHRVGGGRINSQSLFLCYLFYSKVDAAVNLLSPHPIDSITPQTLPEGSAPLGVTV